MPNRTMYFSDDDSALLDEVRRISDPQQLPHLIIKLLRRELPHLKEARKAKLQKELKELQ